MEADEELESQWHAFWDGHVATSVAGVMCHDCGGVINARVLIPLVDGEIPPDELAIVAIMPDLFSADSPPLEAQCSCKITLQDWQERLTILNKFIFETLAQRRAGEQSGKYAMEVDFDSGKVDIRKIERG